MSGYVTSQTNRHPDFHDAIVSLSDGVKNATTILHNQGGRYSILETA